ncbi:hypothetical protein MTO96_035849 [Rhipicephalus appendiculatus]
MASTNVYTVLALLFVFVACEGSAIKGLEPGPTDSLPSKPEGSGLLTAASPKEEMPGVTAFPGLARIPGYDERCNMQATTAKNKM